MGGDSLRRRLRGVYGRSVGSGCGDAGWARSSGSGAVAVRGDHDVQFVRRAGAIPGDLVAVLGVGGLGHLGIQFANKFGYKTVAISRGKESEALAKKLGAHVYLDSDAVNAAEELKKLGGARVILSTAPSGKAMTALVDGLGANGAMLVIGAGPDPISATAAQLIFGNKAVKGWASGTAVDSEDTLRFSEYTGVRPMIEKFPLEKVNDAWARMVSGKAQFRVVLTM